LIPAITASSLDFDDLELYGDDLRGDPLEVRCLPLCG
jgi:hypothetical protein